MGEICVSVVVLTYNHAKFVCQALDSIIRQKTNFEFEILVGDDCSEDGTQEIVKEYALNHKNLVRAVLRKKNIGATHNLARMIANARGKYIAFLEGDDYWIDENKLQIQYDFMESHREYSACGHECIVVNEMNEPIDKYNSDDDSKFWYFSKSVYAKEDYEKGKLPGQGNSWFARNYWLNNKKTLGFLQNAHSTIGDKSLIMLLLSRGNIYFMHRKMHCYRFIEKPESKNWQAVSRNSNRRYEEYLLICKVEVYARHVLNMKLDMGEFKKEKLICASVFFLKNITKENFNVLIRMIFEKGHLVHNILIATKAIVMKSYYLYILNEDRPVLF